jgi:hypothetical protein
MDGKDRLMSEDFGTTTRKADVMIQVLIHDFHLDCLQVVASQNTGNQRTAGPGVPQAHFKNRSAATCGL